MHTHFLSRTLQAGLVTILRWKLVKLYEYMLLEYRAKIAAIKQQNSLQIAAMEHQNTLLLNENLNLENLVDNGNKQIRLLEAIGKKCRTTARAG